MKRLLYGRGGWTSSHYNNFAVLVFTAMMFGLALCVSNTLHATARAKEMDANAQAAHEAQLRAAGYFHLDAGWYRWDIHVPYDVNDYFDAGLVLDGGRDPVPGAQSQKEHYGRLSSQIGNLKSLRQGKGAW